MRELDKNELFLGMIKETTSDKLDLPKELVDFVGSYHMSISSRLFKDVTFRVIKNEKKTKALMSIKGDEEWYFAGMRDTREMGGGRCVLNHELRYVWFAKSKTTNRQVIFGGTCIGDFFEVEEDTVKKLKEMQNKIKSDYDEIKQRLQDANKEYMPFIYPLIKELVQKGHRDFYYKWFITFIDKGIQVPPSLFGFVAEQLVSEHNIGAVLTELDAKYYPMSLNMYIHFNVWEQILNTGKIKRGLNVEDGLHPENFTHLTQTNYKNYKGATKVFKDTFEASNGKVSTSALIAICKNLYYYMEANLKAILKGGYGQKYLEYCAMFEKAKSSITYKLNVHNNIKLELYALDSFRKNLTTDDKSKIKNWGIDFANAMAWGVPQGTYYGNCFYKLVKYNPYLYQNLGDNYKQVIDEMVDKKYNLFFKICERNKPMMFVTGVDRAKWLLSFMNQSDENKSKVFVFNEDLSALIKKVIEKGETTEDELLELKAAYGKFLDREDYVIPYETSRYIDSIKRKKDSSFDVVRELCNEAMALVKEVEIKGKFNDTNSNRLKKYVDDLEDLEYKEREKQREVERIENKKRELERLKQKLNTILGDELGEKAYYLYSSKGDLREKISSIDTIVINIIDTILRMNKYSDSQAAHILNTYNVLMGKEPIITKKSDINEDDKNAPIEEKISYIKQRAKEDKGTVTKHNPIVLDIIETVEKWGRCSEKQEAIITKVYCKLKAEERKEEKAKAEKAKAEVEGKPAERTNFYDEELKKKIMLIEEFSLSYDDSEDTLITTFDAKALPIISSVKKYEKCSERQKAHIDALYDAIINKTIYGEKKEETEEKATVKKEDTVSYESIKAEIDEIKDLAQDLEIRVEMLNKDSRILDVLREVERNKEATLEQKQIIDTIYKTFIELI